MIDSIKIGRKSARVCEPESMQTLFEGARIYTMDNRAPLVESMVVESGRVVAVGSREEMRDRFPHARRVELEGKAVVPAFNDCHCHILSLGLDLAKADLRGCRSIAEIQNALRAWASQNPEASWILGRAYDQNRLQELRHITRQELDAVSADRPTYLNHVSKHGAAVNSAALKIAGIHRETPNPDDGVIMRDERGEPMGILLESASNLVSRHMPKPDEAQMTEAISLATRDMARRGILAASDATAGWQNLTAEIAAYTRALEQGAPVRMTLMPTFGSAARAGWFQNEAADSEGGGRSAPPILTHPNLRWGCIKLFADGALTTRTAAMREPYIDTGGTGVLMYEAEELIGRILTIHRAGFQCAVHAIGDHAIEVVLQGYRRAQEERPREDARHRIEHAMLMAEDLLDEMVALGVVAVSQPEFFWWLAPAYLQGLGDRALQLKPHKTWLQRGIPVAFSSDQPVVPGDPIVGWRAAVTRQAQDGSALDPSECLDPLTALRLFTVGSAYATFDNEIGSLTPGKQARFVTLSERPEQIADSEMKVLQTFCETDFC